MIPFAKPRARTKRNAHDAFDSSVIPPAPATTCTLTSWEDRFLRGLADEAESESLAALFLAVQGEPPWDADGQPNKRGIEKFRNALQFVTECRRWACSSSSGSSQSQSSSVEPPAAELNKDQMDRVLKIAKTCFRDTFMTNTELRRQLQELEEADDRETTSPKKARSSKDGQQSSNWRYLREQFRSAWRAFLQQWFAEPSLAIALLRHGVQDASQIAGLLRFTAISFDAFKVTFWHYSRPSGHCAPKMPPALRRWSAQCCQRCLPGTPHDASTAVLERILLPASRHCY